MIQMVGLPDGCVLRPAVQADQKMIRRLVLSAFLDPTQLRWFQFWVIEASGQVVACGQLRAFPEAQELGSLVVAKDWRGRGLGRALTHHLIQQADRPLYLECLGEQLTQFYSQMGFVPVDWRSLPPSLQRKFALSALAARWFRVPVRFMVYGGVGR